MGWECSWGRGRERRESRSRKMRRLGGSDQGGLVCMYSGLTELARPSGV